MEKHLAQLNFRVMIKLKKIVLVLILAVSSHNVYAAFLPDKIEGRQQKFSTNKRETDREKTRRLYSYMSIIEESIRFFDKGKYNSFMDRLKVDTGFHFTFRSHYQAYNVLNRCMNEGAHNLDITDDEYDQLDSIANSPLTNASAWAAAYLLGINKYDDGTSDNEDVSGLIKIEVYPNPAKNTLTINSNENFDGAELVIYNVLGKQTLKMPIKQSVMSIESLSAGTYLLKIESKNTTYVQKFMVEK